MKNSLLSVAVVLISAGFVSAQDVILSQYTAERSTTTPDLEATIVDATVLATDLSAGSGISAASDADNSWDWNGWDNSNTTYQDAVDAGESWTWGLTVAAVNTEIELTDFDIRLDRDPGGPDDFEIRAAVNGGSSISLLTHDFAASLVGVDFLDVSLAALPVLSSGDSVVFTLGGFNSSAPSAGGERTLDLEIIDFGGSDPRSLRVNGIVTAVPEPSSALVVALAGFACSVCRRR